MDEKTKIILKMFARFPSLATANEAQVAAMAAAYSEALRKFSLETVSAVCSSPARGGAFPKSADELHAECERRFEHEAKLREWSGKRIDFARYRLPPPPTRNYTRAEMADWELPINHVKPYVMRLDDGDRPLRVPDGYPGAGQAVEYGYLTPREAEMVKEEMRRRAEAKRAKMQYRQAAE